MAADCAGGARQGRRVLLPAVARGPRLTRRQVKEKQCNTVPPNMNSVTIVQEHERLHDKVKNQQCYSSRKSKGGYLAEPQCHSSARGNCMLSGYNYTSSSVPYLAF